jgi:YidC/Oxa1 family membrane protein insertase
MKQYKDVDGHPLDLVHPDSSKRFGYPLSLYTADASIAGGLNQALFVPSATGRLTAPAALTFHYSYGDLQATKTFTFDGSYVLHADIEVTRNGQPVQALLSWPSAFGDQDNATAFGHDQLDSSSQGRDQHLAVKKVTNGGIQNGPLDWAGVSDLYFASIFLPDAPDSATLATLVSSMDAPKGSSGGRGTGNGERAKPDDQGHIETVNVQLMGAALGDLSGHSHMRVFVGPKAINVLKSIHATDSKQTLEPVLEFGFWGVIGKYLFLSLQFIHTHVVLNWQGSWGWAIVVLTVLINILMLPFRVKTMHSALKMQRIQPQMDAIKEKYKKYKVTDPKRNEMNAEIMQLQKDNGVNMFGGCIPTLITMPLLFAFFTMIPRVVELRQAHWLWLPNLQAPDPYHILPILMVLSQFLVQFYTPSPGVDPQQQKMMAFMMPLFSGYITWNYPSGLALYWSVGNLIGIAQQAVMNRTSLGREMREVAAKRARRKGPPGQGRK